MAPYTTVSAQPVAVFEWASQVIFGTRKEAVVINNAKRKNTGFDTVMVSFSMKNSKRNIKNSNCRVCAMNLLITFPGTPLHNLLRTFREKLCWQDLPHFVRRWQD